MKACFVIIEWKLIFKPNQVYNEVYNHLIRFLVCFLVMSSNCLLVIYKRLKDIFKENSEVILSHGFNVISLLIVVPVHLDLSIDACWHKQNLILICEHHNRLVAKRYFCNNSQKYSIASKSFLSIFQFWGSFWNIQILSGICRRGKDYLTTRRGKKTNTISVFADAFFSSYIFGCLEAWITIFKPLYFGIGVIVLLHKLIAIWSLFCLAVSGCG